MNLHDRLRIRPGSTVRLARLDPADTLGLDKERAKVKLDEMRQRLERLQAELWAESKRSLLIVLQGMDTSGKDGTIRAVMSGISPIGVRVTAFKAPTPHELDHDFLWRVHNVVPSKGEIAIFNRSHYEDVLIVRVHNLVPKPVWQARYEHINRFERLLADSGTIVLKFFLHLSKEEQRQRLLERLADPVKRWKFSPGDLEERKLWPEYTRAYEDALGECSTAHAPWFAIPSDRNWVRNYAVASIVVQTLENQKFKLPKPAFDPKSMKIPE